MTSPFWYFTEFIIALPIIPERNRLLVELLDLLNLIITSHKDTGSVVDVLRNHIEHPLHVVVDSLAAS